MPIAAHTAFPVCFMDLPPNIDMRAGREFRIAKHPRHSAHSWRTSGSSYEDGGKKTVGAMAVWPDLEIFTHIEVDPLLLKDVYGG